MTRTETVGEDGMVHVAVPDAQPGESIQVTLSKGGWHKPGPLVPDEHGRYRTAGGLEGLVRIAEDFDDPLPEMEPYS